MMSLSLILLLIPLIFALLAISTTGKSSRTIAILGALLNLAVSLYVFSQFKSNTDYQFSFLADWIPSIGASFHIGIDGINLLMILLTNLVIPVAIFVVNTNNTQKPSLFYALILFMQMALLGVFLSLDVLLYYLFWELALLPIYVMLLIKSGPKDYRTFVKFFIYTLAGSLFMLAAILYVYIKSPGHNFTLDNFYNNHLSQAEQMWVYLGFFLAYAIKIPIIPFHTWQAATYTEAPTSATILLSGIMLKMGTFSLMRWLLPITPLALATLNPYIIALCVAGVVYGSIIAFNQKNIKTLFAFSSLAHVGLLSAGIFALNLDGFNGALLQMFNHGIIITGLFLVVEIIYSRTETYMIPELGGLRNNTPKLAFFFLVIMLASIALPLTNGFVGEFLLLNGLFQYNFWIFFAGSLSVILGAAYMFKMYQRTMLGADHAFHRTVTDLNTSEKLIIIPIVAIILLIGLWPGLLLDPIKPSVENLLSIIKIVK